MMQVHELDALLNWIWDLDRLRSGLFLCIRFTILVMTTGAGHGTPDMVCRTGTIYGIHMDQPAMTWLLSFPSLVIESSVDHGRSASCVTAELVALKFIMRIRTVIPGLSVRSSLSTEHTSQEAFHGIFCRVSLWER